jgi:anaerobic dimethyl sulfoxide reductase subunit A
MTAKSKTKIITSSCQLDCGARCILKVYVENGKIISISTDDGGMPGVTACPKGLLQKDVVYAKDRLHQPLKRVGARGSGKFEPVTWDEALDTVAGQLKRVKENYGADSIF